MQYNKVSSIYLNLLWNRLLLRIHCILHVTRVTNYVALWNLSLRSSFAILPSVTGCLLHIVSFSLNLLSLKRTVLCDIETLDNNSQWHSSLSRKKEALEIHHFRSLKTCRFALFTQVNTKMTDLRNKTPCSMVHTNCQNTLALYKVLNIPKDILSQSGSHSMTFIFRATQQSFIWRIILHQIRGFWSIFI